MFTGSRVLLGLLAIGAAAAAFACEEPPAQDPSQTDVTYQNGYAQTTPRGPGAPPTAEAPPVTYTPTTPAATGTVAPTAPAPTSTATAPAPMQTTPVPVGVQALPPPGPNGAAPKTMAVPGPGAFACTSDAQCLLGRCNLQYKRCAYPCKNSDVDCKAPNVCTAAGLCMPRVAGGVGM